MSLVCALALLAVSGEPLAWSPVLRPVIGVMVEETSGAQQVLSRSTLLSGASQALESFRVRSVALDVAEISSCAASLRCRAAIAASAGASLMVVLYLENDAGEARVDVDLLDVARVTTSSASSAFELERAARVALEGRGALVLRPGDDVARALLAWLRGRVGSALLERGMRLSEGSVRLLGLPSGARVFDASGARQDVPPEGLVLVDLPSEPLTLRVEAEDYAPSSVFIAPGVAEVEVSLEATPVRWARRGVFAAGVAAAAVGVAGVIVGATVATPRRCLTFASEVCGSQVVDGLPLGVALVGLGLGPIIEGFVRGEPEAGLFGGLGGMVVGALVFGVLVGAGAGP